MTDKDADAESLREALSTLIQSASPEALEAAVEMLDKTSEHSAERRLYVHALKLLEAEALRCWPGEKPQRVQALLDTDWRTMPSQLLKEHAEDLAAAVGNYEGSAEDDRRTGFKKFAAPATVRRMTLPQFFPGIDPDSKLMPTVRLPEHVPTALRYEAADTPVRPGSGFAFRGRLYDVDPEGDLWVDAEPTYGSVRAAVEADKVVKHTGQTGGVRLAPFGGPVTRMKEACELYASAAECRAELTAQPEPPEDGRMRCVSGGELEQPTQEPTRPAGPHLATLMAELRQRAMLMLALKRLVQAEWLEDAEAFVEWVGKYDFADRLRRDLTHAPRVGTQVEAIISYMLLCPLKESHAPSSPESEEDEEDEAASEVEGQEPTIQDLAKAAWEEDKRACDVRAPKLESVWCWVPAPEEGD